jgi:O-acetyl-ADP-ribose deacetylase
MEHGNEVMHRIEVLKCDITRLSVDAIVNAANEVMLGGGGVDGAIHRAAGPELLQACRQFPEVRPNVRCPTGKARVTLGYNLPARFVIHTVGPIWRGGDRQEREQLAMCYRNSLWIAICVGAKSIAFPAISCGVYRFPYDEAAKISVDVIRQTLHAGAPIERVVLAAFDDEVYDAWCQAITTAQAV